MNANTEEHGGTNLAGHLGLADHAFDCLAHNDAHADAGADCCEAVADGSVAARLGLDNFLSEVSDAHGVPFPFC